MKARKVFASLALLTAVFWSAAALRHGEEPGPGITHVNAAEVEPTVVTGEPVRKFEGDLVVFVPRELSVRGNAFDVLVHFHGAVANQEKNADEAGLRAVIVTANVGGGGSTPYARAFAPAGSLDRALDFAKRVVSSSGRVDGIATPRVNRVALSSWSAGGAAVKAVLERDAGRVDAVIFADGIFSRWQDATARTVETRPLDPIVQFGRRALDGEKLLVITHTAIPTPQYPNVKDCTDVVLASLDIPASEVATYTVDRGGLHVRGTDGTGPADHVAQIRALDEAYALLARRWHH